MQDSAGFAGKILHVDLSRNEIGSESLDMQLAEKFVGGLGISSWLAYNLAEKETDPLSSENTLVFGAGPLVGTLAPGTSRVFAVCRSPLSGFISFGSAGHSMGVMMKYAGYDNLVITGRAEKPVYLKISDEEVEICSAEHLWGKDTFETTDLIWKELDDYWVDAVGPAAENLARYSIILCSKRSSFNKTGIGTVMACKNLKAIAARGTKGLKIADPDKFRKLTDKLVREIVSDPELRYYRAFGGPPEYSGGSFSEPHFTPEEFCERIAGRSYACLSCPVACKHIIYLKNGNYRGLHYRISHMAALAGHNRLGGPENWDELAKCVEAENRYGIDAASTANMLNYLVECYEHGILTEKEIGFVPKRGGEGIRKLIQTIVHRDGIGNLAAEGLLRMSAKVGKESEKYAAHIKGVGIEYDVRKRINNANLGQLTNPRGGHGELSQIPSGDVRFFCTGLNLQKKAVRRILEGPWGFNLGRLTKWVEDYTVTCSSMGFCIRPIILRHLSLELLSQLYEVTTGLKINPTELLKAGERIFNVLKAFNVKAGATKIDDLPSSGSVWPARASIVIGNKEYGTLNQILGQYYNERGWAIETGVPSRQKLIDLGLQNLADDLME